MRVGRIPALAAAVISVSLTSQALAGVNIWSVDVGVESYWNGFVGGWGDPTRGPELTDAFGPTSGDTYLTTPWSFPGQMSEISAPTAGLWQANGVGGLQALVDVDSFSVQGGAMATAAGDPEDFTYDGILGYGGARFTLKFIVPEGGPDYILALDGGITQTSGGPGSPANVFLGGATLHEGDADGNPLGELLQGQMAFDQSMYTLTAGNQYVLEVFGSAQAVADWENFATLVEPRVEFSLSGGLSAVPEPTIIAAIAGAGLVGLRRRRQK